MNKDKARIYLAGPLFGIADRHHNLLLAQELERLGYTVVLPQKEALKFHDGHRFNLKKIGENCRTQSIKSDCIVANIDGPDADSGTAIEIGIGLSAASLSSRSKPSVICVRTDFRTDREREIGINRMVELADKVIYRPAFVESLEDVAKFYAALAKEIASLLTEPKRKPRRKGRNQSN